jgi:hypothetical protein
MPKKPGPYMPQSDKQGIQGLRRRGVGCKELSKELGRRKVLITYQPMNASMYFLTAIAAKHFVAVSFYAVPPGDKKRPEHLHVRSAFIVEVSS